MGNAGRSAIKNLHWMGIVLIALGSAEVLTAAVGGSALVIVIGFILLIAGIVPIVRPRSRFVEPDTAGDTWRRLLVQVGRGDTRLPGSFS